MSLLMKLLCVPVWVLGLLGSLKIHELDLHFGHSICGPWGCGPPVEALLGYHSFWAVLLFPIAMAVGAYLSPSWRGKLGLAILVLGVIAIAWFAGGDTFRYWKSSGNTQYLVQRFFFAIVTKVDIPMLQALTAGSLLMCAGRSKPESAAETVTGKASPFAVENP